MPSITKQQADAYDKILDAAADLAELIEMGGLSMDEPALEELTIFLARNAREIQKIFKKLKRKWL